uniref:Uncharacterized protein n=1 Tax=Laticauda laticaudata TaxID=8630 RepID=A0A8C5RF20_LATLA
MGNSHVLPSMAPMVGEFHSDTTALHFFQPSSVEGHWRSSSRYYSIMACTTSLTTMLMVCVVTLQAYCMLLYVCFFSPFYSLFSDPLVLCERS